MNSIEIDRFQHMPPVAAEPTGSVHHRQAQDQTGVDIAAAADDLAERAPVGRAPTANIARAKRQIVAFLGGIEQKRQVAWVVREVGVHLVDVAGALGQRSSKAGDISGAEAELARSREQADAWLRTSDTGH